MQNKCSRTRDAVHFYRHTVSELERNSDVSSHILQVRQLRPKCAPMKHLRFKIYYIHIPQAPVHCLYICLPHETSSVCLPRDAYGGNGGAQTTY